VRAGCVARDTEEAHVSERDTIERQIRNKELHIKLLEAQLREARGYVQALKRRATGAGKISEVAGRQSSGVRPTL
jgi:predicted RNase H-like nuclease (RuvC/YqgF family)